MQITYKSLISIKDLSSSFHTTFLNMPTATKQEDVNK